MSKFQKANDETDQPTRTTGDWWMALPSLFCRKFNGPVRGWESAVRRRMTGEMLAK